MPTTWPETPSIRIQSPIRHVLSSCSATPPHRLPSVSCSENPIAAVITADVATMPVRFTPTTFIRTMANTTSTAANSTSAMIRGIESRRSTAWNTNIRMTRVKPIAISRSSVSRATEVIVASVMATP